MRFLSLMLFFLLASCAPLRKSQVRLIGNYYNTLANYPGSVRKLNERVAKLSLESNNLKSALFPSDSLRVRALVDAINTYERELILPDSILADIDFLEDYIRGYYILIPNGFNIYNAFKGTSESIVGIFGLKSVVSSILPEKPAKVPDAKKRKIHAHFKSQSKRLKECLENIMAFIDGYAIPKIDETNRKIEVDFQRLFENKQQTVSSLDHYFTYNKYFLNFLLKTVQTRKLYATISVSLGNILQTENEIQRMTAERGKIDKDSYQLHNLLADVEKMKALLEESKF